jgi:hypothetical protein
LLREPQSRPVCSDLLNGIGAGSQLRSASIDRIDIHRQLDILGQLQIVFDFGDRKCFWMSFVQLRIAWLPLVRGCPWSQRVVQQCHGQLHSHGTGHGGEPRAGHLQQQVHWRTPMSRQGPKGRRAPVHPASQRKHARCTAGPGSDPGWSRRAPRRRCRSSSPDGGGALHLALTHSRNSSRYWVATQGRLARVSQSAPPPPGIFRSDKAFNPPPSTNLPALQRHHASPPRKCQIQATLTTSLFMACPSTEGHQQLGKRYTEVGSQ